MADSQDDRLNDLLRALCAKGQTVRHCVVGAGHGGMAMAPRTSPVLVGRALDPSALAISRQ